MSMLSIDPGVRSLGWALWWGTELVDAGASVLPRVMPIAEAIRAHRKALPTARAGILERMVWRPNDPKSQANDLLDVQLIGASVLAYVTNKQTFLSAAEWKGNIPKRIHHPRILRALDDTERDMLATVLDRVRKSSHKEVLDAVGMGLFVTGRIQKAGVSR